MHTQSLAPNSLRAEAPKQGLRNLVASSPYNRTRRIQNRRPKVAKSLKTNQIVYGGRPFVICSDIDHLRTPRENIPNKYSHTYCPKISDNIPDNNFLLIFPVNIPD